MTEEPASPSASRFADLRFLVVEDDPAVAEVIATALSARGAQVTVAATGQAGIDQASVLEPQLIILDLGLPDIDGVDVCRHLRRWSTTPIIVLSADGDEDRKIAALDEGADDYVTKPYSMGELLARLRVALRHRAVPPADPLRLGSLTIDVEGHVATLDGLELHLPRKEFALLAILARNSGRVLTYAALVTHIWGAPDAARTENVRVLVTNVRRKLGSDDDRPTLQSEPGVGYRLLLP